MDKLSCSRTKGTGIISNVIGQHGRNELIEILRTTHFSIIVDESTDRTVTKFLVIIVRYHCKIQRKPVEEFFALPKVVDATAQGLKNLIVGQFEEASIPLRNIIGFASDNASVMAGVRGGLAALLKKDLPWLAVFGCICHSFALCAAAATDTFPSSVIQFSHDIYKCVGVSPKRTKEFEDCQAFVNGGN